MYLENYIQNFEAWQCGESIFIEAPTGMGKTSFVLNQLVADAIRNGREVLYMSNRFLLKEQVKFMVARKQGIPAEDSKWLEGIEEFEGITIVSYQKIQALMEVDRAGKYLDQSRYKYTVFDEVHYILEDSMFNPHIMYLLEYIQKVRNVKIFISATLQETKEYLLSSGVLGKIIPGTERVINEILVKEQLDTYTFRCIGNEKYIWHYSIPRRADKIKVKYFTDFSQIAELINQSDEKWLVFVSNKASVGMWKGEIQKSVDVIYADDKDQEIVEQIVRYERFEKQVLITTKLLDNGVNFKDQRLRNVVIDTISRVEFMQMLGRKRISGDESINLYIPKKSRKYFAGYFNLSVRKCLNYVNDSKTSEVLMKECLADPTVYEIVRRYYVVQEGELTLNPAGAYKLSSLAGFLSDMQQKMEEDEWAYVKEQLKWLDMREAFSEENALPDFKGEKINAEIQSFLEESSGCWMGKTKQLEFRKELGKLMVKVGLYEKRGNRVPGKNVIEKMLLTKYPRYRLAVKKSSRKDDETLWRVEVKNNGLGD